MINRVIALPELPLSMGYHNKSNFASQDPSQLNDGGWLCLCPA